ncbi:hypothetical protein DFJ73DRAFT_891325, partial [Zopfochytrium polystomum]
VPRPYQLELLDAAVARNVVAYLDTGSGKTLGVRLPKQPKKVVFCVPTIPLVHQQAEKIRQNTDLIVGEYSRDDNASLSYWDALGWYHEVSQRQVLVITPQIFLNILRHGFMSLREHVSLIIFDECHHATRNHPYTLIMQEYYHSILDPQCRPKVFGMTASPIYQNASTREASVQRLTELQDTLDCSVITVSERSSVESFVSKAIETIVEYDDDLMLPTEYISTSGSKFLKYYLDQLERIRDELKLQSDSAEQCEDLNKNIDQVRQIQFELGSWCAGKLAMRFCKTLTGLSKGAKRQKLSVEWKVSLDCEYLVISPFQSLLFFFLVVAPPTVEEMAKEDVSKKVWVLVDLISQRASARCDAEEFRGMVFVEKRISAVLLFELFTAVAPSFFPAIKCGFITGHGTSSGQHEKMSATNQKRVLDRFRHGFANLLMVTNVAEEGIDIPACRLVIIFDRFRSNTGYVQSRGRARDLLGAEYIIMIRRNDIYAIDVVTQAKVAEVLTRSVASTLTNAIPGEKKLLRGEQDNALVDVLAIDFYSKLRASQAKAIDNVLSEKTGETIKHKEIDDVKLPFGFAFAVVLPNFEPPFNRICGAIRFTRKLAMQSAALEAVRYLHAASALNDHLLPVRRGKAKGKNFSFRNTVRDFLNKSKLSQAEVGKIANAFSAGLVDIDVDESTGKVREYGSVSYGSRFSKSLLAQPVLNSSDSKTTKWFFKLIKIGTGLGGIRLADGDPAALSFSCSLCPSDGDHDVLQDLRDSEILSEMEKSLQQLVIVMPHSNMLYGLRNVNFSLNPLSPLQIDRYPEIKNYVEYAHLHQYDITHQKSPLFDAFHVKPSRNFLRGSRKNDKNDKVHTIVQLVPDSAKVLPFPMELFQIATILPSVMYRVEAFCLIHEVVEEAGSPPVSLDDALAAFTSPSTLDRFNYERLETLGDAVLKFASSLDLFLKKDKAGEGELSLRRGALVSNRNLYKIAVRLGIGSAIFIYPFHPKFWALPGRIVDLTQTRVISEKRLADVVEAWIGAVYLKGGLPFAFDLLCKIGIVSPSWKTYLNHSVQRPGLDVSRPQETEMIEVLERMITYRFIDADLAQQALRHSSANTSQSYERLEFLGDALLDCLLMTHFFKSYPSLPPDRLCDLRQAAVNNESFCRLTVKLGLHKLLVHSSPVLQGQIGAYLLYLSQHDLSKLHPTDTTHEGPKVLGDLFEAVVGAVFIDSGRSITSTWQIFGPLLQGFLDEHVTLDIVEKSVIRQMHEYFQKAGFGPSDIRYE